MLLLDLLRSSRCHK